MTISERFRQHLQAGNFESAVDLALSEAMNLEIVTWVGDDAEDAEASPKRQRGSQIRTKINLLDGKVENQIGSLFLDGGPYANLREFHNHQIQSSQALIRQKFESLHSLLSSCISAKAENDPQGIQATSVPPVPAPVADAVTTSAGVEPMGRTSVTPTIPDPDTHPTPLSVESPNPIFERQQTDEDDTPTAFEPFSLETFTPSLTQPTSTNGHSYKNGVGHNPTSVSDPAVAILGSSNLTTHPPSIEGTTPDCDSIESILSNLFSPSPEVGLCTNSQDINVSTPIITENVGTSASPPPSLAEPITAESVNLQIDLSIDELLADLFYEDEDALTSHSNTKHNVAGNKSALSVSDPWGHKLNPTPDLNSFADNAPEPPKLSFDR